jgi:aryl-alcohol dehydrogenase-like predicted oxidoreductase
MTLALGTVQFGLPYGIANQGGQVDERSVAAILEFAGEAGIDTIDTAIGYGESEAVLGRTGVANFRVITKLPPVPDDAPDLSDWMAEQVEQSLRRLRVERLRGVLLHRPDQLLGARGAELARALAGLRESGMVEKIGVSIYAPDNLSALLEACDIDLLQAPFNLVDRRFAASGWLDQLKRQGVEIHIRSVFLQGLLLLTPEARPSRFARWGALWSAWDDWLSCHPSASATRACVGFVRSHEAVDRLVVGVDSLAQLKALVAASGEPLLTSYPDIASDDEDLINPAMWSQA